MPTLLPLLILGLPTMGATLGGTVVEKNHGVTEGSNGGILALLSNVKSSISVFGSPDMIKTAPQACEYQIARIETPAYVHTAFLSPSYILEGIQSKCTPGPILYPILICVVDAYLPPALRVAGAVQAFVAPKPSPSDFWEMAKESEQNLQNYVHSLLEAAATYFKSTHFTNITSTMNHIVSTTATFRDNIQGALDAHNVTFDTLTGELEGIFMGIVNDLEKIPPPDKAPGHAERAEMVDKVLDDAAQGLLKLTTRYGIEEEVVTTYLAALKPKVQALTVAVGMSILSSAEGSLNLLTYRVGDINEQHPQLLPALAFSIAVLLIPESWILRPFLSLFGFGPAGPVKGALKPRNFTFEA